MKCFIDHVKYKYLFIDVSKVTQVVTGDVCTLANSPDFTLSKHERIAKSTRK